MFARLFLLFTITTLVEMTLLIKLGALMGLGPTIALVLLTGMIGAWLAKREGIRALASINAQAARGEMPTDGILDGVAVLVAGTLLLTPGVLTDLVGFLLLIPACRGPLKAAIRARFRDKVKATVTSASTGFVASSFGAADVQGFGFAAGGSPWGRGRDAIEGEVVEPADQRAYRSGDTIDLTDDGSSTRRD